MTTAITHNWYEEKEKLKKDSRRVVVFFPVQTDFIKNQKAGWEKIVVYPCFHTNKI